MKKCEPSRLMTQKRQNLGHACVDCACKLKTVGSGGVIRTGSALAFREFCKVYGPSQNRAECLKKCQDSAVHFLGRTAIYFPRQDWGRLASLGIAAIYDFVRIAAISTFPDWHLSRQAFLRRPIRGTLALAAVVPYWITFRLIWAYTEPSRFSVAR